MSSLAPTRDWNRTAIRLVAATAIYNAVEGIVALWSGRAADSISLIGFGLDSFIELAAAAVMLWHLSRVTRNADPETLERSERRVRQFIGVTFFALAAYVTAESCLTFWHGDSPEESLIGIGLAMVSLVVMPVISWEKLRAADRLGSAALRAEAKETLACSYLSFVLLLGLALNAALGWWWADPAAALLMVPWLAKEGLEGLRGDAC
jgi:divalent metal cation (Fe/Co/Zn/Cd) transporter